MHDTLDAIYNNIIELQAVAVSLRRAKKFGPSVHIAIAALEETSKYLIAYCQEHLPPEVFKKRFSHIPKYRMNAAIHMMVGKLSLIRYFQIQGEADEEMKFALGVLQGHLLKFAGKDDPSRLASDILITLSGNGDPAVDMGMKTYTTNTERDRTTSIYVDISDDLSIAGSPKDITLDKANAYLAKVSIGLAVLTFLREPEMTLETLFKSLPRSYGKNFVGRRGKNLIAQAVGRSKTFGKPQPDQ